MRLVFLLPLLIVMTSCSKIKFVYPYSGTFFKYKLEEYFELYTKQEEYFEKEYARILSWHKKVMLPKYSQFLHNTAETIFSNSLQVRDLFKVKDEFVGLARETLRPVIQSLSGLTPTLSKEQLASISNRFEQGNKKYKNKVQDKEDYRVNRLHGLVDDWTGKVLPVQDQSIVKTYASYPTKIEGYLKSSESQQQSFLQLLKQKKSPEVVSRYIENWVFRPESYRPKDYQTYVNEYHEGVTKLIHDLIHSLDEKQKTVLRKTIQGYAKDFMSITGS